MQQRMSRGHLQPRPAGPVKLLPCTRGALIELPDDKPAQRLPPRLALRTRQQGQAQQMVVWVKVLVSCQTGARPQSEMTLQRRKCMWGMGC